MGCRVLGVRLDVDVADLGVARVRLDVDVADRGVVGRPCPP